MYSTSANTKIDGPLCANQKEKKKVSKAPTAYVWVIHLHSFAPSFHLTLYLTVMESQTLIL